MKNQNSTVVLALLLCLPFALLKIFPRDNVPVKCLDNKGVIGYHGLKCNAGRIY